METGRRMFTISGAPSSRSMLKSLAVHVIVVAFLMLVPTKVLLRSAPRQKQLDIVFYRPPEIKIPVSAVPLPAMREATAGGAPRGAPAPAEKPKPNFPEGPDGVGKPDLPPGPENGF